MAISKVVYGGNTLIDLTADTVTADKVLAGVKAHGADGEAMQTQRTRPQRRQKSFRARRHMPRA